jgi:type IV secretory pathway TrbD component
MEGLEVPIHRALTQQIMIAGAPREIAILNGTLTAAMVLGLHSILGLPVGIALHVIAVAVSKHDSQFFATFRRQLKQRRYYGA